MPWLQLLILSAGHMVSDFSQGALPILITKFKETMSLNYTQATLIFLAFTVTSSIIQPLFGVLSDRYRLLWLMPLGIGLAMLGVALSGIISNYYLILAIILLSGLGSAGYHPEASKATHLLSEGPKKASAMAIFSFGGNVGMGFGPLLATLFIGIAGLKGTLFFLVPGAVMMILIFTIFKDIDNVNNDRQMKQGNSDVKSEVQIGALILLIGVVIMRSWLHAGLVNFIPFYFIDFLGESDFYGGMVLTIFLIAGAIGTIIGGPLADYFGLKSMVLYSLILALPLTFLIYNSHGIWTLIFSALDGAVIISTFGVTVVFGQRLLPNNIGLASGLMLGFAVGTGGFGATILGYVADLWNINYALNIIFILPVVGFLMALFLPKTPGEIKTGKLVSES